MYVYKKKLIILIVQVLKIEIINLKLSNKNYKLGIVTMKF